MRAPDHQTRPVANQTYPPSLPSSPPSAPPPPPRRPQPKPSYWRWFVAAAVVATAVVAGAFVAGDYGATAEDTEAAATTTSTSIAPAFSPPTTEAPAAPELATVLLDASNVGETVIPSVVTVQIRNGQGVLGSGSGVVYDDEGHIITNDHVVASGTDYEIVLSDGTVYPARLVGTDPTTDLAVLAVTASGLRPIAVGDTTALTVGDPAVAVGSPLGLEGGPSLTVGVLSAFGRQVQTDPTTRLFGMLQTDAPITQGSSGGALVDSQGRLVGITTAVGVSDVGIEGIGFATPIEIVTRVANEIILNQAASNPYIGITGDTTYADTIDGGSAPIGVRIDTVEPATAAAAAGLSAGDVVSAINDDPVRTMEELIALLRRYGAETTIDVTLDTGATVPVTLGERPGDI